VDYPKGFPAAVSRVKIYFLSSNIVLPGFLAS